VQRRVLLVGFGDVAARVARVLHSRYRLLGVVRRPELQSRLRESGVRPLLADLDHARTLTRLAGLADTIIHLAPPSAEGVRDLRTVNLLAALSQAAILPKRLIYIGTTGVYGDTKGQKVSELARPNPQSARAIRRLDAEVALRRFARRTGVRLVILRVPGIYAEDRLPIARLQSATPAIHAAEDSYTNHIHADDLAQVIAAFVTQTPAAGRVVNVCDDSDLKMGDYFDRVADHYGLPRPPRLTRGEVEQKVSPMLWSFMRESRRLSNHRLKAECRYRLRFPTVDAFLAANNDVAR
jgi:nucleoside-diphosphate-sugar epimerase